MKKAIRIFDYIIAVICAIVFAFVVVGNLVLPDEVMSFGDDGGYYSSLYSYSTDKTKSVDYQSAGEVSRELKLLGVFPVKTVTVTHTEPKQVLVSGEVFGIKLYTDGVIVVGSQNVDANGKSVNPAQEAGIKIGDIIVSINNIEVFSSNEVTTLLNENNGDSYRIKVKRDGRYRTFTLTPVYSEREGCYKAGMWVRDSTAGIGTITFYNKEQGTFASLGHQINDVDTNDLMPLLEGEAVGAEVTRVQKARSGTAGSLSCDFKEEIIGQLLDNNEFGLYGAYARISDTAVPYEIASRSEVHKGKAQIISTVSDSKPKAYDVEITHIRYKGDNSQKDLVIKVTDSELLKITGGIVQGMSGSPVIQDGKLVGALTHVIVNNPEKGYAIFSDTMLKASTIAK
ncbi:MAG: SpoIVB peptidase [Eubacterium sp.]|nr:SpoIVB peptidase [Eubacterium sp.]